MLINDEFFKRVFLMSKNFHFVKGKKIGFYSINDNKYQSHQQLLNALSAENDLVIVNISEPTNELELVEFIRKNNTVQFFGDAVFNIDIPNFIPMISWFIDPENFYAKRPWAKELINQVNNVKNKPLMYDCLLGSTKLHRDLVEKLYTSSNIQEKIIFNYFKNDPDSGIWEHDISLVKDKNSRNIKIRSDDLTLLNEFPMHFMLPVEVYNKTYYSIIAETTAVNSFNQYTEKTAKTILANRPFIVFAGKHYLKNLKLLGFETFSSVIDESYDDIEDIHERFNAAWYQVEELAKLPPEKVLSDLKSVLLKNRIRFLTYDWTIPVKRFLIDKGYGTIKT